MSVTFVKSKINTPAIGPFVELRMWCPESAAVKVLGHL